MDAGNRVSATFYRWQSAATVVWWLLVKATTKKSLDVATNGSVATRPTWLPSRWLLPLQTPVIRRVVFVSSVVAMLVAGVAADRSLAVRISAAIAISLYHLVESSVTCRHGEYPLLYNVWAMCLPTEYASAASLGIAVHFVMSTGIAKLWVGGAAWLGPATMRYYLTAYHDAKTQLSRPLLPSLNRWIVRKPWACRFISVSTIVLECGIVPMALFLPAHLRSIGTLGMVLMHIGILAVMSKRVGIVFCTTLPTYATGFGCNALVGSKPWLAAVAVSFLPTFGSLVVRGELLPENWPSSPVSLFMWSGEQAKVLGDLLMTGTTRVVLGTADQSSRTIIGLEVLHQGDGARGLSDEVVHDCVLRVIGFTHLHSILLTAVPQSTETATDKSMIRFIEVLTRFLNSERRLFESQTGLPLTQAWFVELDSNGRIANVLQGVSEYESFERGRQRITSC